MQFLFSLVWVLPFFIGGNLAAGFVTQLGHPLTLPPPLPLPTLVLHSPCLIKNKSCKANNAPAIKKESPKERNEKTARRQQQQRGGGGVGQSTRAKDTDLYRKECKAKQSKSCD